MLRAIQGGLSLAVFIIVTKMFLPDVADSLILLTTKVITVLIQAVDQAQAQIPQ